MKAIRLIVYVILILPGLAFSPAGAEPYLSGYVQGLYGGGLDKTNPTGSDWIASENRLQIRLESFSETSEVFGRIDFVYDDFNDPALRSELREAYAKFRLGSRFDIKIGRQIATWGTGDLIFINDLFAKDYRSFFNGRDDQYLKAPHNALRVEYYSGRTSLTLIYSPRFTPNIIPSGQRLSYYNPLAGAIVGGENNIFEGRRPEEKFRNGELAARINRYFGSADVALYFYRGFYKNPIGMDMEQIVAFYPRLHVYGGSVRLPILGGILWGETGYYHSRQDKDGDDPFIENSSISSLAGFERQIGSDLTANIQYQNRLRLDYEAYLDNLPPGMIERDEVYHLVTSRITKLLMMETLNLSGFVFYSPSEEDAYIRLAAAYKHSDPLTITVGGNIFAGNEEFTDFGSFRKNDNLYLKITYGY